MTKGQWIGLVRAVVAAGATAALAYEAGEEAVDFAQWVDALLAFLAGVAIRAPGDQAKHG